MGLTLRKGLPASLRLQGARLYWQAFGPKLGRVLGPEARALIFLDRVIAADQCLIALDERGLLLGLAGFKTTGGSFAGGTSADLRAIYGWAGAIWRGGLLLRLNREIDRDCFLMDGLCVSEANRGQGVGTALLEALYDHAATLGYRSIRLDVTDTNPRARALYQRQGFMPTHTAHLGLMKHVFGFTSATTMQRPLTPAA